MFHQYSSRILLAIVTLCLNHQSTFSDWACIGSLNSLFPEIISHALCCIVRMTTTQQLLVHIQVHVCSSIWLMIHRPSQYHVNVEVNSSRQQTQFEVCRIHCKTDTVSAAMVPTRVSIDRSNTNYNDSRTASATTTTEEAAAVRVKCDAIDHNHIHVQSDLA